MTTTMAETALPPGVQHTLDAIMRRPVLARSPRLRDDIRGLAREAFNAGQSARPARPALRPGGPLRDRITRSLQETPGQTVAELCQNLLMLDRSRELRQEVHRMHHAGLLDMTGQAAPYRFAVTP